MSAARIKRGQVLLPARWTRLATTIDQRTRNVEAIFELDLPAPAADTTNGHGDSTTYRTNELACRIGEAVEVEVDGPINGDGWWVPSTALIPSSRGLWSILVASHSEPAESPGQVSTGGPQSREPNWIVRTRQVELVRTAGEWSQLQGPLAGSDLLILEGTHRVTEGQKVRCDSSLSCEPLVGGSTDEHLQP